MERKKTCFYELSKTWKTTSTAKTSADKKHFPRTQKFCKGTKYISHTENRRRKSCFVWEREKNQKGKKELYIITTTQQVILSAVRKKKNYSDRFSYSKECSTLLQLPQTKPKKRKPRFLKKRKTFEMCLWQVEGCSYSKAKLCWFLKEMCLRPPLLRWHEKGGKTVY